MGNVTRAHGERAKIAKRGSICVGATFALTVLLAIPIQLIGQQPNPNANTNARVKVDHVRAVLVTAYPGKFLPSSAEISERKFMLIVQKKDGPAPLNLAFERLTPNDQPAGQIKQGKATGAKNWITVFTLQPGRYRLLEATPSGRSFILTVH